MPPIKRLLKLAGVLPRRPIASYPAYRRTLREFISHQQPVQLSQRLDNGAKRLTYTGHMKIVVWLAAL